MTKPFSAIVLAVTVVAAAPLAAQSATPLWSGLTRGMPADQVIRQVAKIGGVKRAKARLAKNGVPIIEVTHETSGIPLLGMRMTIRPLMDQLGLSAVLLSSSPACVSEVTPKKGLTVMGVSQKYSTELGLGKLLLQDLKGQPVVVENAQRFTNGRTRASVFFTAKAVEPPEPLGSWARGNLPAQMSYNMKRLEYEQTIKRCPEAALGSIHVLYEDNDDAAKRDLQLANLQQQSEDAIRNELEKF